MALGALPVALFADRVSRVKSIVVMATVWSLATISCMFTRSYGQLLAARAVVGLGEAGYGSVGAALIASHFPARMRGALLAGFFASASVGSVLGVMLGGVIAAHWGWKAAFGVVGIPGLVLALLYLLVRDYRTVELTPQLDAGHALARASAVAPHRRACWRARAPCCGCASAAPAQLIVVSAVWSWLPSFLNRVHGIAPDAGRRQGGARGAVRRARQRRLGRGGRPRRRAAPGAASCAMVALLCVATMLVLGFAFGAPRLGIALVGASPVRADRARRLPDDLHASARCRRS